MPSRLIHGRCYNRKMSIWKIFFCCILQLVFSGLGWLARFHSSITSTCIACFMYVTRMDLGLFPCMLMFWRRHEYLCNILGIQTFLACIQQDILYHLSVINLLLLLHLIVAILRDVTNERYNLPLPLEIMQSPKAFLPRQYSWSSYQVQNLSLNPKPNHLSIIVLPYPSPPVNLNCSGNRECSDLGDDYI